MSVASKNPYAALGDEGGDSDSTPRTGNQSNARNAAKVDPKSSGGRRGVSGNEAAYRDHNVGSDRNRGKPTEEGSGYRGHGGGRGARVRGGRGARYPRNQDDRHSKGLPSGSEKQAAQSWGAQEGEAELKDEQAGDEIAKTEQKEDAGWGDPAPPESTEPAEPEQVQISYADYVAQQEEKKQTLESESYVSVRRANEGSKLDKKWASATALVKEDEDYFTGSGGKAKRERERKTKNVLELDNRYIEPDRARGGRGGRGGRGRGDGPRRGPGGPGGLGGPGGPGGPRGGPRGGARGGASLNPSDSNAFPKLGQ